VENILTIVIPTYNRNEYLLKQCKRLLPQLNDSIFLIIMDNNSDYPAQEYLIKNGLIFDKNVQFIRHETNIGGDANIARAFEFCHTEWLWILSDDDLISNTALLEILSLINQKRSYLFINLNAPKNLITRGLFDFCKKMPSFSNAFFISICLYNNLKLKPYLCYYYHFLSSHFGQLLFVLKYLEENPSDLCYFSNLSVLEQSRQADWSRLSFLNFLPVLRSFKNSNNYKAYIQLKEKALPLVLNILIITRYVDHISRTKYFKIFFRVSFVFTLKYFINIHIQLLLFENILIFISKNLFSLFINAVKLVFKKTIFSYND